jgi:mRNA interferase MazF
MKILVTGATGSSVNILCRDYWPAAMKSLRYRELPGNVVLQKDEANMPKRCVVNVTQIKAVDKKSLREKIGTLSNERMAEVYQGIKLVMNIP